MRSVAAFMLVLLFTAGGAAAGDLTRRSSFEGALLQHQAATAGNCTIIQYDICSGFVWTWSGLQPGDEIGVTFDLPALCSKSAGGSCTNNDVWWYWRNAVPGRGFTLTYEMYAADSAGCKTGALLGSVGQDPVEGWNHAATLGTTTADMVVILARFNGTFPYAISDNNVRNANGGAGCSGAGPGAGTSYRYKKQSTPYCPPIRFSDDLGYVDLLVKAAFTCEGPADNEEASWGGIKALFR